MESTIGSRLEYQGVQEFVFLCLLITILKENKSKHQYIPSYCDLCSEPSNGSFILLRMKAKVLIIAFKVAHDLASSLIWFPVTFYLCHLFKLIQFPFLPQNLLSSLRPEIFCTCFLHLEQPVVSPGDLQVSVQMSSYYSDISPTSAPSYPT